MEAAYEPMLGAGNLPGHYNLGFGYDTSTFAKNAAGLAVPPHRGNTQFWALFDQLLLRQGKGDTDGLIVLGGFIHNDPNNSIYAEQYFAGLLDRAFWPTRPMDTIGVLLSYNTVSGTLTRTQELDAEFGHPSPTAPSARNATRRSSN